MAWLVFILSLLFPTDKVVALTFDACPTNNDPSYDEGIVEVLLEQDVDATMFLSGRWVEKHERETKKLAEHFEIASHGYTHVHYDEQTSEWVLRDLARAQRVIENVTGKRPKFFRPPAIKWNEDTRAQVKKLGLRMVTFDVASGDPDPNLKADAIVRYVLWKTKPGSVLIFHVNGKGWTTAETLPKIIRGLRKKGYGFVTVSELLDVR